MSRPWIQTSMGAPGGPVDIPWKVRDLTPGMAPTSFSHMTRMSWEWIPRSSDGRSTACMPPRWGPDAGISPRLCPTRERRLTTRGLPEAVSTRSERRIMAASIRFTAASVSAGGVPLGNSTLAVTMNPSTSPNTSNLRIPPFIKPRVIISTAMAVQKETYRQWTAFRRKGL